MQSQLVVFSLDYKITCMYKEKETRINISLLPRKGRKSSGIVCIYTARVFYIFNSVCFYVMNIFNLAFEPAQIKIMVSDFGATSALEGIGKHHSILLKSYLFCCNLLLDF